MKILILIFCLFVTGCAATPPPPICLGSELECRVAQLEREVRESEDLAVMCRRNPSWAICK